MFACSSKVSPSSRFTTRPPRRGPIMASALPSDSMKKVVSTAAALLVSLSLASAPANASYFTQKIAEDEALIDAAQAKLDAALQLQLTKTRAEAVGKKQEVAKRAGALNNQLESKLTEDLAALNAVKDKASSDKEAARVKANLEKEVNAIINTESKLTKEVKMAQDKIERDRLIEEARIAEEKQRKAKAAEEVKRKLQTIKASAADAPNKLTEKQEKQEADAITNAVNSWVSQFEKL